MTSEIITKGAILIVDDSPGHIDILSAYLKDFDFKIYIAENGEDALKQSRTHTPDLILLDVMMPGFDGFETCRRLKDNPQTKDIVVIFMTALTDSTNKLRGFEVGAVDYITKPLQYQEVLARVKTHLAVRTLQKQLEAQNTQLQQEITERKQAEKELKKYQDHLEELVAARTIDLQKEITERKQAEETRNRYTKRLKILRKIDRDILAAHSPKTIAQAALSHIRQLVPCWGVVVGLFDFAANEAMILAIDINTATDIKEGTHLSLEPFEAYINTLRQGEIVVHTNPQSSDVQDSEFTARGIHSYVLIPLTVRGELIGSLSLLATDFDVFTEEHIDIASQVANLLAVAVQQAHLFEAEIQRRQEAEALRDIAAALNSTLNLDEVLDRILTNIERVIPHDATDIMLVEAGIAHIARHRGYADYGLAEALKKLRFKITDISGLHQVAESGEPLVIADTQTYPDWVDVLEVPWIRSHVCLPIRLEEKITGFLNLNSSQPGFFTTVRLNRLQAFTDQAAVALENARLHAEMQRRAGELATLNKADQAMVSSLELNTVLEQAMAEAKQILDAEGASVLLYNSVDNDLVFAAAASPGSKELIGTHVPLTTSIAGRVAKEKQSILVNYVQHNPHFYQQVDTVTGMTTTSLLAVPLIFKENIIGVIEVVNKLAGTFNQHHLELLEALAGSATIAIENARLYEQAQQEVYERERVERQIQKLNQELEQRVEDRTRELSALYEVTAVASESLDLETMLEQSLSRVLVAMKSNMGLIHLIDKAKKQLYLAVQQGLPLEVVAQEDFLPLDSGLAGWVIKQGEPLILPDITVDARAAWATHMRSQTAYAGVPIKTGGQVLGVLGIFKEKEQKPLNMDEVVLLTSIADHVGVVVESTRLRQQAEQAAVIEERARLARDLHDSVTQLLYSLTLFAKVAREAYHLNDRQQVDNSLTRLGESAEQALKEMRLLVYELRPSALEQDGLIGALQQRLDTVERRAGVKVKVQIEGPIELPEFVEEGLYYIAQEALNNALKHTSATAITIRIYAHNEHIELEIIDNGSGFNPDSVVDGGGFGLVSMQERIKRLGGVLTILSTPGKGTTIKVNLNS